MGIRDTFLKYFINAIYPSGGVSFSVVLFGVIFDYFRIISLEDITCWDLKLLDILYIFLLLNCISGVPYTFWMRWRVTAKNKLCYECGRTLQYSGLKCPKCGEVKYQEVKKKF